ncbi:MAG: SDR family NAD(P)-dependent oxidoreductase [Nitrospiraceae bacterium]|nr:MAG: SDR family NAD(P)-dependent oxidoreductase [Nitrospiraceae bacterium]
MVCLVTGSSRGLGKAAALAFGRRGHCVAVHCKGRREEAERVSSQIEESCVLMADVRIQADAEAMVGEVLKRWRRLDVLVNNAGITRERLLLKTTELDFDDILNTNLKGPFHLMRAAGHAMMVQKSGHIINISSYAGIKGTAGLSAYSASKAGLIGLTKTAARELIGYNIMVNAVLPGYMLTDMGADSSEMAREMARAEGLVPDFSLPDRAAEFICSLAESSGISGQVFNLDSRII